MISAAAANRRAPAAKPSTAIGGIDLSSWLSWTSYGLGFALALHMVPDMADDLLSGGIGVSVIAASVAGFFMLVLLIQQQMNVSLHNARFGEPLALVTDGVFALSRNPMYVAFLVPILALSYYSPLSAAAAATLYVVSMNSLVIAVEEEALEATFGNRFHRYCLDTPRWLIV